LSPFDISNLLTDILSAHDEAAGSDSPRGFKYTAPLSTIRSRSGASLLSAPSTPPGPRSILPNEITVSVQSAGFVSGNFARIEASLDGKPLAFPTVSGRGLNVAVFDPLDGSIIERCSFDTHASAEESEDFARLIDWVDPGTVVAVVAKDDAFENLTEAARLACESLGSTKIRDLAYRDSWCLVGEKGSETGSATEILVNATAGPTELITRRVDMIAKRRAIGAAFPDGIVPGAAASQLMPSNGIWHRRRKNDGALNRVPNDFYPKVWGVLSRTTGILIGKELLPRDPTVSEKTPEELNFALQIESLLDVIRDPAERQVAVECLVVISSLGERNPEIQLNASETIDLLSVVRTAIETFWIKYTANNRKIIEDAVAPSSASADDGALPGAGCSSTTPSLLASVECAVPGLDRPPVDIGFGARERLARRVFFDLPQEGPDGTMAFLAEACVRSAFAVRCSE
ncbi:hypothetical protein BDK51DRAFT_32875, partial [Blyttiomyces helicus]